MNGMLIPFAIYDTGFGFTANFEELSYSLLLRLSFGGILPVLVVIRV